MCKRLPAAFLAAASFALGLVLALSPRTVDAPGRELSAETHAWEMFDWWYSQRALPYDLIPQGAFQKATDYARTKMRKESRGRTPLSTAASAWRSLGPFNVGGRILSLAVDPLNTNIVWAGAASGGLWKSSTGGVGASAWSYVNTGFPCISVGTIAIDPVSPAVMYIGTGEISYYHFGQIGTPGARASYGLGILKSADGGQTWSQTSLTWTFPQITAVQKIAINPLNTRTLYAATSEGVFKSTTAGATWDLSDSLIMAMDVVMNPVDTTIVYASHGNLNSSPDPGIYFTSTAGQEWFQLTNGVQIANFGRTALAISPQNPSIVYAAITSGIPTYRAFGLYRTTDDGGSWTRIARTNWAGQQGWYDNAVAVSPRDPSTVFCSGLDVYRRTGSDTVLNQKTNWTQYLMDTISPGGIEGTSFYAHADHHAIAIDPLHPDTMYFGTDGGVFKSVDGGDLYFGVNGGLVTTQFYNGFACSPSDSSIAFGGLQDNGVLRYEAGTNWGWRKVDDGDGGWCAISPVLTKTVYDEYIYGAIKRSVTGGGPYSFQSITSGLPATGLGGGDVYFNFIAPYVISRSDPNILYLGGKTLYKSTNRGTGWFGTNGGADLNGTKIACIGVSATSPDTLMAATGSRAQESPVFQVFRSTNGGQSWSNVTGTLPDRYPTDIEFDPTRSSTVYITYSGYGTPHCFRTTNTGGAWTDITSNLPDIPHQSVVVDPMQPQNLYVGTDLGVYHSSDHGSSWEEFSTGMPPAMITDLAVSNASNALRAATFGNGVYERPLVRQASLSLQTLRGGEVIAGGYHTDIRWSEAFASPVTLEYSLDNGAEWTLIASNIPASENVYSWLVPAAATSQGRVRISETGGGIADSSGGPFTILLNPDLFPGWNLLSVRLRVNDPRKSVLFPGASSSAFGYNGNYIVRDSLLNGTGYWLKFGSAGFTDYGGDSLLSDTIRVRAGWNLVGGISVPIAAGDVGELPAENIRSPFFSYQAGNVISDSLEPGQGYWVKATVDGRLVLAPGTGPRKQTGRERSLLRSSNSLTIRDSGGREQTLYFSAREPQSGEGILELPPPGPEGNFDVRYASGALIEYASTAGARDVRLSVSNALYPLTVRWQIREAGISAALIAGEERVLLDGEGSAAIRGTAIPVLHMGRVSGATVSRPPEFSLAQNYPNPFNPRTHVQYAIASLELVTLKVYDVLGREVTTLVNEVRQPGEYIVDWDASGLPSGVYLYRLQAGSFSGVKKLVLLK